MALSEREKFIYYQAIMMTSERAKNLPNNVKQQILDYLRKTNCKTITNEMWHEIKLDLDKETDAAITAMFTGVFGSLKGSFNIKEFFKILKPKAGNEEIEKMSKLAEDALAHASEKDVNDALKAFSNIDIDPELTRKLKEQLRKDRPDLNLGEP